MGNIGDAVTLDELEWDTEFFGITCGKATLHRALNLNEWENCLSKFNNYGLVSIINKNSDPKNAQLIGKYTSAFIADVNIQFEKKILYLKDLSTNVTIHQALEKNKKVIEIANFQFSKFTEDPELAKRGGKYVYQQWLINSFENPNKFFALSKDMKGEVNGFLLFSYSDNKCVIELIAVSQKVTQGGIGTSLISAVEYEAYQKGVKNIRVGTQVRNLGAINFYHKMGCKQVECHQIYHLWNL